MSNLSDFAARQKEYNDQMQVVLVSLEGDVQHLHDLVKELQESPGKITPEDQQLLDNIDESSKLLVSKFAALDSLTPPKS